MRHGGIAVTCCGIGRFMLPHGEIMAKFYRSVTCPKCRKIILRGAIRNRKRLTKELYKAEKTFWNLAEIYDRKPRTPGLKKGMTVMLNKIPMTIIAVSK